MTIYELYKTHQIIKNYMQCTIKGAKEGSYKRTMHFLSCLEGALSMWNREETDFSEEYLRKVWHAYYHFKDVTIHALDVRILG